ncbi:hypothetical protein ON010_g18938 [Phytophthora cinnamomi]|nr:hypothetical protein ON010_g18938 [Phytophthora cinnamomi]
MRSFLTLLSCALTVATLLYMGQEPDPPARVAELISGLPSKDGSHCDVANIDTLRHAAIVYTAQVLAALAAQVRAVARGPHLHRDARPDPGLAGHDQPARARRRPGRPAAQGQDHAAHLRHERDRAVPAQDPGAHGRLHPHERRLFIHQARDARPLLHVRRRPAAAHGDQPHPPRAEPEVERLAGQRAQHRHAHGQDVRRRARVQLPQARALRLQPPGLRGDPRQVRQGAGRHAVPPDAPPGRPQHAAAAPHLHAGGRLQEAGHPRGAQPAQRVRRLAAGAHQGQHRGLAQQAVSDGAREQGQRDPAGTQRRSPRFSSYRRDSMWTW